MTGDQRGDEKDNILAGYRMLDAGLTYLDAGLVYLDADLCTNQEWIRCRFGIFRRRFGINRCSFVKFLGENLCQIDAQK